MGSHFFLQLLKSLRYSLFLTIKNETRSLQTINFQKKTKNSKFFNKYIFFIAADYIHPCTITDPELKECVKKEIQENLVLFTKGIPKLGVNSTDPVYLDNINIDGNGLKLEFTNAQMHGLSNSKLNQFE